MEAMFSGRHFVEEIDGAVFVERDPEIFKHVLAYLRSSELPPESQKEQFDIELEYWGIPSLDQLKLEELQNIFDSEPNKDQIYLPAFLKWKEMKPLNLLELIQKGDVKFDNSLPITSFQFYDG